MAASLPLATASPRRSSLSVTICPCPKNMRDASAGIFTAQLFSGSGTMSSRENFPACMSLNTTYMTSSFVIEAGGMGVSAFFSKMTQPLDASTKIALPAQTSSSTGETGYGSGLSAEERWSVYVSSRIESR